MIGVIAKPGQHGVVEEFFELFKTPWEFYAAGRVYEVIVATCEPPLDLHAQLLIVYGAKANQTDRQIGVCLTSRRAAKFGFGEHELPLYTDAATFDECGCSSVLLSGADGVYAVRFRDRMNCEVLIRAGYDLFDEVESLLEKGQPVTEAHVPSLDLHIALLREWIVAAGVPLIEVSAAPTGHAFSVCLTHDIDFVGIRRHRFDHSMWGFLYRSTLGALGRFLRRKISAARLLACWRAAAALPFVLLGWAKDFWEPFEWYLTVERNLPATYFLIPFKGRAGDRVPGKGASRRAAGYGIKDILESCTTLISHGCELGVHGIDSWQCVNKGKEELAILKEVVGEKKIGVRMHWLLRDEQTFNVLEQAGYEYDSTAGYNETIGFRNGTTQVFRPLTATTLLELPLHIQDGALFYPKRLDLTDEEARTRCDQVIRQAKHSGGVVTLLWHDRSHGPERFWGDFYIELVNSLRSMGAWFGTVSQVVEHYRKRRQVRFERLPASSTDVVVRYCGDGDASSLVVNVYRKIGGQAISETFCTFNTQSEFVWSGAETPERAGAETVELRAAVLPA